MTLTLRYVARSDTGLVRDVNEDSGYAGPYLLAVADGMGGHAAGEVASHAAIDELIQIENPPTDTDPLAVLAQALKSANDRIRQLVEDDPSREGMGTTVTAFLWTGTAFAKCHIGDSRAYLLRDGGLTQITHDHTFVQTLVDEGRITPEEAGVHPARSFILKALQGQPDLDPDFEMIDVQTGDRLLVCSDGLDNARVPDSAIATTLSTIDDVGEAADELIRLAKTGGAPDNVTVVVADVLKTDKPREPDDTVEAYLVGAATESVPEPSKRRSPAEALRNMLSSEEPDGDGDDPEAQRYAPRPPRRFRLFRTIVVTGLVVLIGWGGLALAQGWVDDQYYVGEHDGEVAIFRGLSQEVGPIRLSRLYNQADGLPVESLPSLYQEQVTATIAAKNVDDARTKIAGLRDEACAANMSTPSLGGDEGTEGDEPPQIGATVEPADPTAGATSSGRPTVTPTPDPGPTATPLPVPEPTPDYPGLECPESP
jgi:protein phosphatase